MPKMLSPNTTVWWVPADAITNTADLFKAATYTGGTPKAVDISCAIAAGMTLGATDSDTDDSRTIAIVVTRRPRLSRTTRLRSRSSVRLSRLVRRRRVIPPSTIRLTSCSSVHA